MSGVGSGWSARVGACLGALHRGLASLGPTATGTNILNELVRKVRDVLVWRVQMKVTWTSRERFIEELVKAHDDALTLDELSALMNTHSKTVGAQFPSTFLSNVKTYAQAAPRQARPKRVRGAGSSDGRGGVSQDDPASEVSTLLASAAHSHFGDIESEDVERSYIDM